MTAGMGPYGDNSPEQSHIQKKKEEPKISITVATDTKPTKSLISKVKDAFNIFGKKEPVKLPVEPVKTTPIKSIKWTVKKETKAVVVNVYDENGKKLNTYTISNYITLNPGQTLEVISK